MNDTKKKQLFVLLLTTGILLNLFLVMMVYRVNQKSKSYAQNSSMLDLMEQIHSLVSYERVLAPIFNSIFTQINGKDINQATQIIYEIASKNNLPENSFEVILFSNGKALNTPDNENALWETLFKRYRQSDGTIRPSEKEKNDLIKLLNSGVGFEVLEGNPGTLQRLSRSKTRTFAIWFSDQNERTKPKTINGLIVLIHQQNISEQWLIETLLLECEKMLSSKKVSYVDMFRPGNSILNNELDLKTIYNLISSFEHMNTRGTFEINNKKIILSSKPTGRVFFITQPESEAAVPLWTIAIAFFWIPALTKHILGRTEQGLLSVYTLTRIVIVISIVIPACATTFYWLNYINTRQQTAIISKFEDLSQYLVQIDSFFNTQIRTTRQFLDNLVSIVDNKPKKIQEFIDKTVDAEIKGKFDTCLLVNTQGQFVRPYSSTPNQLRQLTFHSPEYRNLAATTLRIKGWLPCEQEAEYILNPPPQGYTPKQFVSMKPAGTDLAVSSLARIGGTSLISDYNRDRGFISSPGETDFSTMVVGAIIEDDASDPMGRLRQSIGNYIDMGMGTSRSLNYVDVIHDSKGRAIYCATFYIPLHNFTINFLYSIFSETAIWPENTKYFALSDQQFRFNFPQLNMWQQVPWLFDILQPPDNTFETILNINNEPMLFSAYRAQNTNYILAAATPVAAVKKDAKQIQNNLYIGGLLLTIPLLFVYVKVRQTIILPVHEIMRGVNAIEKRRVNQRISIETGDEWQELAETLNTALESLKELEVAGFVQNCILPSEPITAANSSFYGKTVSADDVGGDYFDAFVVEDSKMLFLMGDVSGHSVSAALVVAMVRAAFTALVDSGTSLPQKMFNDMNRLMLTHLKRIKMMTCFAAQITGEGTLTICNAGQSFPFLIDENNDIKVLKQVGYPLGAAKKRKFTAETIKLPPKCRIVMFSDGIIEAMNKNNEQFGYKRLEKIVKEAGCNISQKEFIQNIYEKLDKFSDGIPWGDDVTIVTLDHNRNSL